jgi:hypothetical protein
MKYTNNVEFFNKNISTNFGNILCNKIKQVAGTEEEDSIKEYIFSDEIGLFPILINYTHSQSGYRFIAELVNYNNTGNSSIIDNDDENGNSISGFEIYIVISGILFLIIARKRKIIL